MSDGSSGTDYNRFQTSNQKANSQVENRIGQALIGKINNNSQAAGTKLPLGNQNGTSNVFSQITF
jgi:hypothetical protein